MKREKRSIAKWVLSISLGILFFLSSLIFFLAKWYTSVYGQVGFDAVLFTLISNQSGVSSAFVLDIIFKTVLPSLLLSVGVGILLFFLVRKKTLYAIISCSISFVLAISLLLLGSFEFEIPQYIQTMIQKSVIFDEDYVKPTSDIIEFPEEKRNLIYIFMESMETTFFDKENGGAFDSNVISELCELAKNNVNFSQNGGVGGALTTNGSTWTIGAMVSHTTGVPLKMPASAEQNLYGNNEPFLPGITSLQNILAENGYHQSLMVGSDAKFGGRYEYYTQHGCEEIFDLYTAFDEDIVYKSNDWWGFDDKTLIDYAKEKLTDISKGDKPFAFTMLTVDTHHVGGYKCELCGNEYEENYQNVYACASKQMSEFITWLQAQDFYENTTIIISGDHQSMDNDFMKRNIPDNYTRRIYNCIINPACEVKPENTKNRDFTTLDMFPTTLAAIGCKIEGERLGLGTNLFSGVETLTERYGFSRLNQEVSKTSVYYNKNFLGIDEE